MLQIKGLSKTQQNLSDGFLSVSEGSVLKEDKINKANYNTNWKISKVYNDNKYGSLYKLQQLYKKKEEK